MAVAAVDASVRACVRLPARCLRLSVGRSAVQHGGGVVLECRAIAAVRAGQSVRKQSCCDGCAERGAMRGTICVIDDSVCLCVAHLRVVHDSCTSLSAIQLYDSGTTV